MYYLIGYRIFGGAADYMSELLRSSLAMDAEGNVQHRRKHKGPSWLERAKAIRQKQGHYGKSMLFETVDENLLLEVGTWRQISLM